MVEKVPISEKILNSVHSNKEELIARSVIAINTFVSFMYTFELMKQAHLPTFSLEQSLVGGAIYLIGTIADLETSKRALIVSEKLQSSDNKPLLEESNPFAKNISSVNEFDKNRNLKLQNVIGLAASTAYLPCGVGLGVGRITAAVNNIIQTKRGGNKASQRGK